MKIFLKILFILLILQVRLAYSQISPGDLSQPHSHLEGISNCTRCHEFGNKVTSEKCLSCHTEIAGRIRSNKGYHSSSVVKGKQCIECHNEHHGKKFQLIRLNTSEFNHDLTGYRLSLPHSRTDCGACHNEKLVKDPGLKEKDNTWLGTGTSCLDCHTDYHLGTLSSSCLGCHAEESFDTAPLFSHDRAKFKLAGKHRSVDCDKCHKIETVNGQAFQEFKGVAFASCKNCHDDPHNNKFGSDCRKCHTENSFMQVKNFTGFDHSTTAFPLNGKHMTVDCRSCHKAGLTAALRHEKCTDCHSDYHKGQFKGKTALADCSACHSTEGFELFTYTIEHHNQSSFPLKGAHAAQPCIACHKKQPEWSFRQIGSDCLDCHENIHKSSIDTKFYPEENCRTCHNEVSWAQVAFDHSVTRFSLTGRHVTASCKSCHFREKPTGPVQEFKGLASSCSSCHIDVHRGQFPSESCSQCHNPESWRPAGFDHNKTAFKLDGEHLNVPCSGCHKPLQEGSEKFTLYKIKDFRCESCHY